jgi:hypothetical protein
MINCKYSNENMIIDEKKQFCFKIIYSKAEEKNRAKMEERK